MLKLSGQTPTHSDRDTDPLPLSDLWHNVLSGELPQQSFCFEWLFDKVEQKQRSPR
ncbi:hypothetical protein EPIB1_771 [Tritonibacter mobilis]|jgi:hypothetical protein|nr:hypothetical protein SCH4B_1475 [Ruegeria sp. TrichCH4B]VCU57873.1 hypothetical protein EPIB1_771 [Tritonibacter mobilis]